MPESFEKSVKGATKSKLAPPKSKYIEHILIATHAGESGVAEVFRVLQNRLRDSTWTIVFKSLIVVHLMIREGVQDVTLKYLSHNPQNKLAINNFTEVQTQGRNIRAYADYLIQRAKSYARTKVDYVRAGDGRLKKMNVEKGLLRETEEVQEQIWALLRCDFLNQEPENEITLTAFRLLTIDLIALYYVMNEGTMNVLEHFVEMSKPDAERALNIYKRFCKQTEQVISYLQVARAYEHATRLEIPKMKHAPTKLTAQLEEHINATDFDSNRRQLLAERDAKKLGKKVNGTSSKPFGGSQATSKEITTNSSFPEPKPAVSQAPTTKATGPDLIDFFESIEQNQVPMVQQTSQPQVGVQTQSTGFAQVYSFPQQNTGFQQQALGFPPQATGFQQQSFGIPNGQSANPFAQVTQPQATQIQPNFTGAGFGGYTPQPQAQTQTQQTGFQPSLSSIPQSSIASFPSQLPQQSQFTASSIVASPTGSTNPFRQPVMATGTSVSSASSIGFHPTGSTMSSLTTPSSRQSTNPFAKTATPPQAPPFSSPTSPQTLQPATPFSNSPFQPALPQQLQQPQQPPQPQATALAPAPTGLNPFAKPPQPTQAPSPFALSAPPPAISSPTGSTNPFRQSTFVNQATGQGWQQGPQGTIGGFASETLGTTAVFPRPGQPPLGSQQNAGWQG